jgi:hypothetical protein
LRVKSANRVLRFFHEQQLCIPRLDRFGDLIWKNPSFETILTILKNPAYAGAFVYGRSQTQRDGSGQSKTKILPIGKWKIVVKDKYPGYITWETFERIQAMLQDNYAEYDRNKNRGIPRDGAALLHGMVYCGECGHKMVVCYKKRPEYECTYLHQKYQVPVCQHILAQPIDDFVVQAFFEALSPIELDAYEHALKTQAEIIQQVGQAHQQQLERLRYQAALAQRQYNQVDPDNRLVASELEKRWEAALAALKEAEDQLALHQQTAIKPPFLPPDLKAAFSHIAQKLPEIWNREELLPSRQKKALLRCLIDKVVIHHSTPNQIQTRIVWKGGQTTEAVIPVTVGKLRNLPFTPEMEDIILKLSQQGKTDQEIAQDLTESGFTSPRNTQGVLPSTVQTIRLKHRSLQQHHQSHPRQIPGYLTISQIAPKIGVTVDWLYHLISIGKIKIIKNNLTGLYLFPDQPETLDLLLQLKAGSVQNLNF